MTHINLNKEGHKFSFCCVYETAQIRTITYTLPVKHITEFGNKYESTFIWKLGQKVGEIFL